MDRSACIHPDRTAPELYLTAAGMQEPALKDQPAKQMGNPQQELKTLSSREEKKKKAKQEKNPARL